MTRRPRLLAIGQALRPTGYARVLESLLPHLARTFDATLFAVDHLGPGERRAGFTIRGNDVRGDPYGRHALAAVLEEEQPDAVLIHHDTAFFSVHRDALAAYGAARVVVYCPADWEDAPVASLHGADAVVAFTRTGRERIEAGGVPVAAVIGHGVDTATFRRGAGGARARLGLDPGAFVVLNANRDMPRKRLDVTVEAFSAFARDRPHARLVLHTPPGPVTSESLGDRVVVSRPPLDDAGLAALYAACDVGVSTADAEGWGLVAFEHAATGAAQVVPGHGTPRELWHGHALTASGAEAVAAALGRLHDDPALRTDLAARALAHAGSERFAWPALARAWERVLLAT